MKLLRSGRSCCSVCRRQGANASTLLLPHNTGNVGGKRSHVCSTMRPARQYEWQVRSWCSCALAVRERVVGAQAQRPAPATPHRHHCEAASPRAPARGGVGARLDVTADCRMKPWHRWSTASLQQTQAVHCTAALGAQWASTTWLPAQDVELDRPAGAASPAPAWSSAAAHRRSALPTPADPAGPPA